ncbi:MAG: bifunctional 23S rRNA (guanine(2069)-N(7))-methyltransferase RlmK/23S rRNA (guanine(2445)-N(2))-methyltransferase RlmL [Candidatus Nealsonbacteria bacterium]|nr:bifunctional 23S rRNA (guanine(2069)-N(7))-methyltransferase RlmK/23S rRNA (guanine(2445)-N(2))-methyltransferase RlmL [Candidatus Nealsonbacteria bacterium]
MDLLATSTFGLEAIVARELEALGYTSKTVQPGRMLFEADVGAIARANLWLRAADRVLVRLGAFEATDFGQLFDQTYALPWEEWIPADGEFPVKGRSIKSQLSSVPACQKIVKKAIVEKLRAAHGVQELAETGPRVTVEVALLKDLATLVIDTTGPGLHKRGYRKLAGRAPLKETLAAAMVMLSFWRPERPLIDPFCGTGTIPIEAAMIGRNMAPGLNREFAAEAWPRVTGEIWEAAREEARQAALPGLPTRIIGTDVDGEALSLARYHAQQAGVAEDVHFQRHDFAQITSSRQFGCVIGNPPYGQRMGERDEVQELYRAMPDVLRRLKTWSHYILTSHPNFEALVGQKADRRRKLYNGRIECTYFQFHGPEPGTRLAEADEAIPEAAPDEPADDERPLARPAFGGLLPASRRQAEEFRNRLTKRARHLRRWPSRRGITCYRLYERDVPEVPLVVDRYEDYLHVTEYERPHERSAAEHADWLDLMVRTAGEVLDVPPEKVFTKLRLRQRGSTQYERYADDERTALVSEGGLRFRINLSDYVDTGLFLDHRITRSMVRDEAKGKRFLNLFAYTGAFTVYAAAGGAASTTSVDLSNTYLDWARKNMTLNDFRDGPHHFVRNDAMSFLESHAVAATYDLALVDPPTFSNSKRTEQFWDVQRDHVALLNRLFKLMSPGGVVFFSTNFRRFKLAEEQLAAATIQEISRQTVPEDFRNRRIHRCWRIVCQG